MTKDFLTAIKTITDKGGRVVFESMSWVSPSDSVGVKIEWGDDYESDAVVFIAPFANVHTTVEIFAERTLAGREEFRKRSAALAKLTDEERDLLGLP